MIVVIGVFLGWFHFSSSNDAGKPNFSVSVDKGKIEADKTTVVDKVQHLEHKAADKAAPTSQKAQD